MKIPPQWIAWPIAAVVLLFRWTCRLRVYNDPRPELKRRGVRYAYSILHGHQLAAAINTEPNTAAMVSQSGDGELMVRAFLALGVTPVRGSSRKNGRDRGGAAALDALTEHVASGTGPAIIAVDGPRGPKGCVKKGIAALADRADAAVLNVVLIPKWRLRITPSWDRFQVPIPFTRIDAYFAEPIRKRPNEGVEALRRRIEDSLNALEAEHDPTEARAGEALRRAA
ncbi:hypothetical protein Pla108_12990 [Botrimarina colliarenosi]|uniref:DUF374 domain-containing protein n=1 Tax=Botrimarina colliarenosi TaxID=2528001 RepID=A0A5C6AL25_9BACT|nr:DUF374 domain-containing protein [Botrimarina colliarenosi]TWU00350.1 hypothetical protein Pla108_12990 [Botrimarina colliarenosi]